MCACPGRLLADAGQENGQVDPFPQANTNLLSSESPRPLDATELASHAGALEELGVHVLGGTGIAVCPYQSGIDGLGEGKRTLVAACKATFAGCL